MRVAKNVVPLILFVISGARGRLTKTALLVDLDLMLLHMDGPAKTLDIMRQTTREWRQLGAAIALLRISIQSFIG